MTPAAKQIASAPKTPLAREAAASVVLDGETQHCEACFDEIVVMGPERTEPSKLQHTCGRAPASGVQAEGARCEHGRLVSKALPIGLVCECCGSQAPLTLIDAEEGIVLCDGCPGTAKEQR